MTDNLPAAPSNARRLWNIVKAVGPFFMSQSEKMSEAYAGHKARLAEVYACKELFVSEGKGLIEIRKKLLERYFDAPPEDRFFLRRDLDDLDREARRLAVYQKSLDYLPAETRQGPTEARPSEEEPEGISSAWLDRFNEFARAQNEPWRRDLLSRALGREADQPGSIGPRALWFIGTVDEGIFHAFAGLIDTAIQTQETYIIPNYKSYSERPVPTCALGSFMTIGHLIFSVGDLGLIGDPLCSRRNFAADAAFDARYGGTSYIILSKLQLAEYGILLTTLGNIIASLYTPKPHSLGEEIFSAWIERLRSQGVEVTKVT